MSAPSDWSPLARYYICASRCRLSCKVVLTSGAGKMRPGGQSWLDGFARSEEDDSSAKLVVVLAYLPWTSLGIGFAARPDRSRSPDTLPRTELYEDTRNRDTGRWWVVAIVGTNDRSVCVLPRAV